MSAAVDKRIIKGEPAQIGDFPYMVSIQRRDGYHNCGGVLLDSTTVLTAAHCAIDNFAASVRAGALNQTTGGVVSEVVTKKQHPEYKAKNAAGEPYQPNDIAILKLKTPIEEAETIAYAQLPTRCSDPVVNSTASIAGWGATVDMHSGEVNLLNKATVSVLTREDCKKLDAEVGDRDTVVCAGGDHRNVCKYDSGGPLVDEQTGTIIGVASFIIPQPGFELGYAMLCAEAPALFTRVGSYVPFILENLDASKQGQGDKTPESCKQPEESDKQPEQPDRQPEQPDRQQELQSHCGRAGNDNDACMRAAFRCTGVVNNDAPMVEFLECVDRMQVCKEQGTDTDACRAKAKECKEKENLLLGDLLGLAECSKNL